MKLLLVIALVAPAASTFWGCGVCGGGGLGGYGGGYGGYGGYSGGYGGGGYSGIGSSYGSYGGYGGSLGGYGSSYGGYGASAPVLAPMTQPLGGTFIPSSGFGASSFQGASLQPAYILQPSAAPAMPVQSSYSSPVASAPVARPVKIIRIIQPAPRVIVQNTGSSYQPAAPAPVIPSSGYAQPAAPAPPAFESTSEMIAPADPVPEAPSSNYPQPSAPVTKYEPRPEVGAISNPTEAGYRKH